MDRRHIGAAFKSIAHRIDRIMNNIPAIRDNGKLTSIQVWILNFLFRNEGKDMFQRDVEAEFNIRRSTATGILQLMEKNGFLLREPVAYDARLKKLVLTERSRRLVQEMCQTGMTIDARLLRGFSPDEVQTLYGFLDRMFRNLE